MPRELLQLRRMDWEKREEEVQASLEVEEVLVPLHQIRQMDQLLRQEVVAAEEVLEVDRTCLRLVVAEEVLEVDRTYLRLVVAEEELEVDHTYLHLVVAGEEEPEVDRTCLRLVVDRTCLRLMVAGQEEPEVDHTWSLVVLAEEVPVVGRTCYPLVEVVVAAADPSCPSVAAVAAGSYSSPVCFRQGQEVQRGRQQKPMQKDFLDHHQVAEPRAMPLERLTQIGRMDCSFFCAIR